MGVRRCRSGAGLPASRNPVDMPYTRAPSFRITCTSCWGGITMESSRSCGGSSNPPDRCCARRDCIRWRNSHGMAKRFLLLLPGVSGIASSTATSTHLNRLIKQHDLDMIYVTRPGHGGPGIVANTYLEGTYSEIYADVSQDQEGMKKLFRQFSFPGGIPSHVAPETPGSIHEGGELGYALSHAYGAAFDNPNLIVSCVVGDGEAETGPMATGWHSNKFLNP